MPKFLDPRSMKRLREKAHAHGATMKQNAFPLERGHLPVAPNDMFWNLSGNCLKPRNVLYRSRDWGKGPHHRTEYMELMTKCRECENCLRQRGAHWRLRALAEYRAAPRSWLWTLTLTPEAQLMALSRARRHLDAQGVDFDLLDPVEQFDLRHRETGRLVTLALKRLRKGGSSFRYLMVAEAHSSGLPHYHVLVHELSNGSVRHAMLKRAWRDGFCDAKLIEDAQQATYACKYLTKSVASRVRASIGYGNPPSLSIGAAPPQP